MKDRAAFDPLAEAYDRCFSDTDLGRALRAEVWSRADRQFAAGDRVLDIGCGSGEDALHLARRGCSVLALDPSPEMCRRTRVKADACGLTGSVQTVVGALGRPSVGSPLSHRGFDGAISSFGAFNCVEDLALAAEQLGRALRPGAVLVASIMPPTCLWEIAWYLCSSQPRSAFRRLSQRGVEANFGAGALRVHYPSPRRFRLALRPWFRQRSLAPLGLFLPPTYAMPWLDADSRRFERLQRWEVRARRFAGLAGLADHYLMVLERVNAR